MASSLRRAARAGDLVARLGGDEFAIILHVTDDTQLTQAATRVQSLIRQPRVFAGDVVVVEAAVGGSRARPSDDVKSLLARADATMYQHKHAHRRLAVHERGDGSRSFRSRGALTSGMVGLVPTERAPTDTGDRTGETVP